MTIERNILPQSIGFDKLLSVIDEEFNQSMFGTTFENKNIKPHTYPPYNIVKVGENSYEIQIAVAGFNKEMIKVVTNMDKLIVTGEYTSEEKSDKEQYLYRGLAHRSFRREFTLADTVFVSSANIVDGVLKINLENEIPERKKYKQIEIGLPENPKLIEK